MALAEYNAVFNTSINSLRHYQKQSIDSILKGDTICILPTGYGKSLIYEILPFFVKGAFVVVVVPLNAIIHQEMKKLGENALHLTKDVISDIKSNKTTKETQGLRSGHYKYVLAHPENILEIKSVNHIFMNEIYQNDRKIFIVVDEAHCVMEWGLDFRPMFLKIFQLRSIFPMSTFVAMSATVTKDGQKEISRKLKLKRPTTIACCPTKENLSLLVVERPSFVKSTTDSYDYVFLPLLKKLRLHGNLFPMTLVYCRSMEWAGYGYELAQRALGPAMAKTRVSMFHSSIEKDSDQLKREILSTLQEPLNKTSLRLVFATVALGMGADLQHVEQVIHAGCPKSLESYVQQIGRSGRSGCSATAVMFCNKADSGSALEPMKEYCRNTKKCRRKFTPEYILVPQKALSLFIHAVMSATMKFQRNGTFHHTLSIPIFIN